MPISYDCEGQLTAFSHAELLEIRKNLHVEINEFKAAARILAAAHEELRQADFRTEDYDIAESKLFDAIDVVTAVLKDGER